MAEDLDRLFLDQRESAHGRESFRELGDFLAHRDERDKGPVTQRVRDVFTSFRVWSFGLRGLTPTIDDLRAAGVANLNLLADEELEAECGLRREVAKLKFERGLRTLFAGHLMSDRQMKLFNYLGNRFVWKPAFTDEVLFEDFVEVSIRNQVLLAGDRPRMESERSLLTLYAIARLHGSVIKVADGQMATLYAGFANDERRLEVKVDLGSDGWEKPVHVPICMFWTGLRAEDHCDASLLGNLGEPLWNSWKQPIELSADRKLRLLV